MDEKAYDVIVIGAGAGGIPAAIRAAQLGGRVAIVEQDTLGGLCMNRGCIPVVHMMVASSIIGNLVLGKEMGLRCQRIENDYGTLKKRQEALIDFMRQGVQGMLRKNGIHLLRGKGTLDGPGRVRVNGEVINGRNIIVATGGRWTRPSFPGADLVQVSNSDYLLTTKTLPSRCLVCGGGPVAIEIAQFLSRFGSNVFLVTKEKSLLDRESKTIRSRLSKVLQKEGIKVYTRAEVVSLEEGRQGLHCVLRKGDKEEAINIDRVISVEREANLKGLGLDTVGLQEDAQFLVVNEKMETSVKGLYGVGDISAPENRHYSHAAAMGGIIAAENAMGRNRKFDSRLVTRVAFTQPQIACVGYTKKEAKKAGYDVVVGSAPLSTNPLGMILSQNEGIVEVVSEKKYGEILGIHILGEGACEMAGGAIVAIQMELCLEELANVPFPHPTLSESLSEAARDALGVGIYLP